MTDPEEKKPAPEPPKAPTPGREPLAPRMLTPEEIEALRQNQREVIAYGRAAWARKPLSERIAERKPK
jgi:hypothetical protein